MQPIDRYFPDLTDTQRQQIDALYPLYSEWNAKINVISRKDIDNLYLHHVLHSLGIAKVLRFNPGSSILDVGTGGGFPGIPLAILFPDCQFRLIDRTGKKIRVATEVAQRIGLQNVTLHQRSIEEEKDKFDFIVSRAVMPLSDLIRLVTKNVSKQQNNALPNGLICLKGGELQHEIQPVRKRAVLFDLKDYFQEEFFTTKQAVYVQL